MRSLPVRPCQPVSLLVVASGLAALLTCIPSKAKTLPTSSPAPATVSSDSRTSIPDMVPVAEAPAVLQSGVPAIPEDLRERLDQYLNTRPASLAAVLPDGSGVLISTRFATTAQLHFVAQPMGDRQQITFRKEPVGGGQFVPGHPHLVVFGQDAGGGEAFQYHLLDRKTGRVRLLTDGTSRHIALRIHPRPLAGGRVRVAFSNNARSAADMDVRHLDWDPLDANTTFSGARIVVEAKGTWFPMDWSPDGRRLLVSQFRSADDSDLHVLDLQTAKMLRLTPDDSKASVNDAEFSADGGRVLLVTDRYGDFKHLYEIPADAPMTTDTARPLTAGRTWDVEALAVASNGTIAFALNEDGLSKVYVMADSKAEPRPASLPAAGVLSAMAFPVDAPDRLFLAMDSSQSPNDVFEIRLDQDANQTGEAVRWTRGEIGGLDSSTFVGPEIVRYPSTGGFTIPAVLFRPAVEPGRKSPVLVIWHGGPEGQSRPNFSAFVQFLVQEMGVAVLLPNVRGSDGYGKAFLAADNGVLRERSLEDIGATLDWIQTQPDLDPTRVGAYGGSYGGYMTLATAAFYPDRIRAAVNVVGISNIASFLENTQAYRRDLRRAEYGDERDPAVRAVQERISPLNSVHRIEAAMFVQQGMNDPRVPQSEAEQIVRAVRARHGGDPDSCWYLLATNEGHGFAKKDNRDYALAATVLFLQKHLVE